MSLNNICQIGISFSVDDFRILYSVVTTLVFFFCTLFSKEYFKGEHNKKRFFFFWALTYLAVIGFMFAADFFTLFMCFEIMSFASFVWVIQEENEEAQYAGKLYIRISVICGMIMLYGVFLVQSVFDTVDFEEISQIVRRYSMAEASYTLPEKRITAAFVLLLIGFGAKAGMFLLHVWLPRAHTVAPAPASAVLSGILTKTGIIGIIISATTLGIMGNKNFGNLLLIFAALTMFTGAFLALFSDNLKKTLACSSVSQIGFILSGVAVMVYGGNVNIAYSGTLTHMLNHSMIKLCLFLLAGAVLKTTGTLKLNEVRGWGRKKYGFMVVFLICTLSLAGVPLFSGYVSKTLLHEGVEFLAEESRAAHVLSLVFTVTGGMTLCYMLKLFVILFVEKPVADFRKNVSFISKLCVIIPGGIVFLMGIVPSLFAGLPGSAVIKEMASYIDFSSEQSFGLSHVNEINWLSLHTMKGNLISLAIGVILYILIVHLAQRKKNGEYKACLPFWFDLEKYVYRPVFMMFLPFVLGFVSRCLDQFFELISFMFIKYFLKPCKVFKRVNYDARYQGLVKIGKTTDLIETSIGFALILATLGVVVTLGVMLIKMI